MQSYFIKKILPWLDSSAEFDPFDLDPSGEIYIYGAGDLGALTRAPDTSLHQVTFHLVLDDIHQTLLNVC